MIHKKILDLARDDPQRSTEGIAGEVSGASAAFVERVLDEYGDPATGAEGSDDPATDAEGSDDPATDAEGSDDPATDAEEPETADAGDAPVVDADDDSTPLTDRQRETLRVVHERPTASQKEVGDVLAVSRATVSRRLNDVPGFDWRERRPFVERLFGPDSGSTDEGRPDDAGRDDVGPDDAGRGDVGASDAVESGGPRRPVDEAEPDGGTQVNGETTGVEGATTDGDEAVDDVAAGPEDGSARPGSPDRGLANDPALVHKVAHACLEAEYVSTEEELRILQQLLVTGE